MRKIFSILFTGIAASLVVMGLLFGSIGRANAEAKWVHSGFENIKEVQEGASKDGKVVTIGIYTAETSVGQTIRYGCENYKGKGSISIRVVAKNGSKVVKEFKNKNNQVIEFKVEKGITDYEIHVEDVMVIDFSDNKMLMDNGVRANIGIPSYDIIKVKVKGAVATGGTTSSDGSSKDESGMSTTAKAGMVVIVGAGVWGASKFFGGKGEAPTPDGSEEEPCPPMPPAPNNPHYKVEEGTGLLIYTDPAGWQMSYHVNKDGEWENDNTGGILDYDKVDDFVNSRTETQKWASDQRGAESETTKKLREIDRQYNEENERITNETAREKMAIKTGSYGLNRNEMETRFENLKTSEKEKFDHYINRGNQFDTATKVAQGVEFAADVAMDTLGATGGPAKALTEGYKVIKGTMKGGAEAFAKDKGTNKTLREKLGNMAGGMFNGGVNGTIDAIQYHTGGSSLKTQLATNIGGDALRGGLNAAYKGENVLKGVGKGIVTGTLKVGVNQVGAALKNNSLNKAGDKLQKTLVNNKKLATDLAPKTIEKLDQMAVDKFANTVLKDTLTNGAGKSVTKKGIGTMFN